MKKTIILSLILFGFIANTLYDKDKDPLHKKIYTTTVTEVKSGMTSNKSVSDEIEFKNNKLFSNFLNEKFGVKYMSYTITKDTTFLDSITEAEVRYFEVKALYKDEDQQETHVLC
ncbi:MAG: hypothetical protein N2203_08315, partial [Bacteroidia bacterium]|nr:hypothetical protein [Bacteroidia bacterium]